MSQNPMPPEDFIDLLGRERASAILRWDDQEVAAEALAAVVRGGFRIVEVTLTVPGALELVADLAARKGRDGLAVGAGTVLTQDDARQAVEAGADFLVSPVVDEAVIRTAGELGAAMMPGTHTPTEMLTAYRAGAPLQKLFPAPGLGPAYVRSVLGPMPFLRIVPTNGVDEDNALDWLEAGAYALGFVATLFAPDDLREERYDVLEERARRILGRVRPS